MSVEVARRGAGKRVPTRPLKKIAQAILDSVGRKDAELSLALVGNAEMRRLNATYRKKDYPTDVLSFPIDGAPSSAGRLLGDVVISVDKAREQATQRGRTEHEEIVDFAHPRHRSFAGLRPRALGQGRAGDETVRE